MRATCAGLIALLLLSTCEARWRRQDPEAGESTEEELPVETQDRFEAMDDNQDEQISESELADHASEMPHADINYEKVEKIMDDADTNDDNYVDEAEFEAAGANHEGDGDEGEPKGEEKDGTDDLTEEVTDQANPEFQMFDSNGDSCIGIGELENVINGEVPPGVPASVVKTIAKSAHGMCDRSIEEDDCCDQAEFDKMNEMQSGSAGAAEEGSFMARHPHKKNRRQSLAAQQWAWLIRHMQKH